jgi:Zn finger protein HypA/HybF involved in hydrogenase expression
VHEFSVALEICRIAEAQAAPRPASAIVSVGVEIGEGTDLVVENLNFCLETLLASPPFERAALAVERVPGNDLRVAWLEVDDGR